MDQAWERDRWDGFKVGIERQYLRTLHHVRAIIRHYKELASPYSCYSYCRIVHTMRKCAGYQRLELWIQPDWSHFFFADFMQPSRRQNRRFPKLLFAPRRSKKRKRKLFRRCRPSSFIYFIVSFGIFSYLLLDTITSDVIRV